MARPSGTKNIETPEMLWDLFKQYVQFEIDNPMYKVEYVGREGKVVRTPLETPITFEGFECYLQDQNLIQDLGDYSKNDDGRYSDYAPIITRVRNNCYVHNFKGAAIGIFSPNLIARKLGLVDKTESKTQASINVLNFDPIAPVDYITQEGSITQKTD
jgi:hypothetical protein